MRYWKWGKGLYRQKNTYASEITENHCEITGNHCGTAYWYFNEERFTIQGSLSGSEAVCRSFIMKREFIFIA